MLAAERHLKIIEIISETGSAQVEQLSKILDVSPMTIRRDLEKLQEGNMIERCHGGAVMKQEVNYFEKRKTHPGEKVKIAQKSADYVKNGDTIFLDAGTTTYEIAKLIKNMQDLTVITNDIEIASLLKNSDVELLVCGGNMQKSTGGMYGLFANQMMENVRLNIGFFGAASIDENFNVLTPTMDKVSFKRLVLKNCQRSFLVVDDSKFNRKALLKINNFKDYTGVITNKIFTRKELKSLDELGIRMITVK
ncbi:DeoR family transcriptional regulator [Mobilisporobacter senegalensis]|uniref:DeoR family transcriptional regulator n=1 Tax=Mobilisporobacter senegalensis TaxID=1329262 RepID=A0A3N1XVG9_9FIRM|nr:DeoR/GlpR family DNA-binding transcription regulator [Mobilisporobacter senegalensis]ROR30603.1 DeoR family transcriptional regulator [Mobilisporobacter senegalensis]